jgi:LysM repeat protein
LKNPVVANNYCLFLRSSMMRKWTIGSAVILGLCASLVFAGTVPPVPGNDGSFLDWDASVNGATGWGVSSGGSLTLESPDGTTPAVRVVDDSETTSGYGYINYNSTIPTETVYVMTLKFWANTLTWSGMIVLERNTNWQKAGANLWEGGANYNNDLRWDAAWQTSLRDENDAVYSLSTGQWYTVTIKRNSLTEFEVWIDDGTTLSYLGTQTSSVSNYDPRTLFVGATNDSSHTFDGAYAFVKVGLVKETVATPVITPEGPYIAGATTVTIDCATEGATIYYTTDGSTPSASSNPYSGSFTISEDTILKAIAVKAGWFDSGIARRIYSTAGLPEPGCDGSFLDWDASVNGATGWGVGSGGSLTLESPDGTTPAVRVVDNSETTLGYGYINYNSTIPADTQYVMTLKFWANALTWNGMIALERNTSWQKAGACLYQGGLSGTSRDLRWDIYWDIGLRDVNNAVYFLSAGQWYTVTIRRNSLTEFEVWVNDGTETSYLGTRTSSVSKYDPRALFVGGTDAASHTFDGAYAFVKVGLPMYKVSPPVFTPSSSYILGPTDITMSCDVEGASIYYTTDSSTPTVGSAGTYEYNAPVTVSVGTTLKAIAVKDGYVDSAVTSQTYAAPPASAPTFTPGGSYISGPTQITISSDTDGASIYYTLDGNPPTTGSQTYTGPVTVNDGETLQAIAIADGYLVSDVTSLTFEVPSSYNNPVDIPYGSATIDGDLSDWSDATWTPLDVASELADMPQYLDADVPEAYYTARWQANKVYVAVKVRDTYHVLTDSYVNYNVRDAVEIFLHTDNNGEPNYSSDSAVAQQYEVGVKIDTNSVWACVGAAGVHDLSTTPEIARAMGYADGEWLQYEIEMTPYTYFGFLETGDLSTSLVSNLFAGQVIGLDVDVISCDEFGFVGKKSENTQQPRWNDWRNFGLHKLEAGAALLPGDANDDKAVDVGDLGILAANYGRNLQSEGVPSAQWWSLGDFNNDGAVDVGDLGILAANYGTAASGADWDADYAKVFGTTTEGDSDEADESNNTLCSALGLPLIAGLVLMGLMLVKLDE